MLDLGGNRLRKMEHLPPNLAPLPGQEQDRARGERVFPKKLKVLDVQSNRLNFIRTRVSCRLSIQLWRGAHNAVTDPPPDALQGLPRNRGPVAQPSDVSGGLRGLALGDLWSVQRRAFLRRRRMPEGRAAHVPVPRPQPLRRGAARYANYLRALPLLERLGRELRARRGRRGERKLLPPVRQPCSVARE